MGAICFAWVPFNRKPYDGGSGYAPSCVLIRSSDPIQVYTGCPIVRRNDIQTLVNLGTERRCRFRPLEAG